VIHRNRIRQAGVEYEFVSVLSLRKSESRWFVLLDDELNVTRVITAQINTVDASGKETVKTLDLRGAEKDRVQQFIKAAFELARDPQLRYRIIVGTDEQLAAEIRELTRPLILEYRIQIEAR